MYFTGGIPLPRRNGQTMNSEADSIRSSPEFDVVRLTARTRLTDEVISRIHELPLDGLDWNKVYLHARFHRTLPLLSNSLHAFSEFSLPNGFKEKLSEKVRTETLKTAFLVRELHQIMQDLSDDGIKSLTLKGPALAQLGYGQLKLRPFIDVDLLIQRSDFSRARDRLSSIGYRPFSKLTNLSTFHEQTYLWQTGQFQFRRARGFFNLDLHVKLLPPLFSFPIGFEELYDRSRSVTVSGTSLKTFSDEDMLLILCFHLVKNRWEQLKHVCDISEFVQSAENMDWDLFFSSLERFRCARISLVSLSIANHLLDMPLPPEALGYIRADARVQKITRRAVDFLPNRLESGPASFRERLRDTMTLLERPRDRARYLSVAIFRRMSDFVGSE